MRTNLRSRVVAWQRAFLLAAALKHPTVDGGKGQAGSAPTGIQQNGIHLNSIQENRKVHDGLGQSLA
jgi:hypothetical protein